jgi:uncharacterized membrane protein
MFKKFLIAGALVWLPIIATIWIIRLLVNLFDELIAMIPTAYRPEALFGMHIPGLGIIVAAIVVLVTGILVTNFLGNKLIEWLDTFLKHVPFIGSLYSTIKQVLQTIMSSDGQSFRKVLLVEYPRQGLWSIAFQTSDASEQINVATGETMIVAFIPTTPNPTSGFLILVPKEKTKLLDMSVEEAFKVVVSLGTLRGETADAKKLK